MNHFIVIIGLYMATAGGILIIAVIHSQAEFHRQIRLAEYCERPHASETLCAGLNGRAP